MGPKSRRRSERVLVRHAHADGAAGFRSPPEVGAARRMSVSPPGQEGAREGSRIVGNVDAQGIDENDATRTGGGISDGRALGGHAPRSRHRG